jgi:hypothetical protein
MRFQRSSNNLPQWLNTFVFLHRANGGFLKIYKTVIGDTLPPVPTL